MDALNRAGGRMIACAHFVRQRHNSLKYRGD
jgi:hypothetical protein